MPTKPSSLPRWAESAGGTPSAEIDEPLSADKDEGWDPGGGSSSGRPPNRWFNWWMNLVYRWLVWLDSLDLDGSATDSKIRQQIHNWTMVAAAFSAGAIYCVGTYEDTGGGARFVAAVGSGGRVAISGNGGWGWPSVSTVGAQDYLVLRGLNGIFFASGNSGQLATSVNGAAFSAQTSNTTNHLREGVAWNGSTGSPVYLVAGSGGKVTRSTNGTAWAEVSVSTALQGIAYGAGKFVAVNAVTKHVFTSTDGSSWTDQGAKSTLPDSYGEDVLRFANGLFIFFGATAGGVGRAVYSADGLTWTAVDCVGGATAQPCPSGYAWNGTFWLLLNFGASTPVVSTSKDGITWTVHKAYLPLVNGAGFPTSPFYGAVAPKQNGAFVTMPAGLASGVDIAISMTV